MSIDEARRFATWLLADQPEDLPQISDVDGEELYREFWLFIDFLSRKKTPPEKLVEFLVLKATRLDFDFSIADYEAMIRQALESCSSIEWTVWGLTKDPDQHTEEMQEVVRLDAQRIDRSPDACRQDYEDALLRCLFDHDTLAEYQGKKFPKLNLKQKEGVGWVPIKKLGLSCFAGENIGDILKHTLPRDLVKEEEPF